jgi:hypothetical protein
MSKIYDKKSDYCKVCKKTRLIATSHCCGKRDAKRKRYKCTTCGRIYIKK